MVVQAPHVTFSSMSTDGQNANILLITLIILLLFVQIVLKKNQSDF